MPTETLGPIEGPRQEYDAPLASRAGSHDLPPSPTETTIDQLIDLVLARLVESGAYEPETADWRSSDLHMFEQYARCGCGITTPEDVRPTHVRSFMDSRRADGSAPSPARRRVRLIAIKVLYREALDLGLVAVDPTRSIPLPRREHLHARPLTDEEIERGRTFALASASDFRRSVSWALTEATGRTSEIGLVRARDVRDSRLVWLPGSTTTDARVGLLTDWGAAQVEQRLRMVSDPEEWLIRWRTPPRVLRAACSQAVTETLKRAGLHGPDVRPRSIVAWAGRSAHEDGLPIEEVTRQLGMRSPDEAALFIGLEWRASP